VSGPCPMASTAPIADDDVAAVAARALLTDDLVGIRVPLTGPRAHTNAELVEVIGGVLHRDLRYQEAAPDAAREQFLGLGFPTAFADAYLALLAETVDRPALVTDDVEKVLDRSAKPFAQWVSERRRSFSD
jgi:uncharacterized protein YbjT (DUF2867 family)